MYATAGPDSGLLSPVRAGTRVERITDDTAWLQAVLDAETICVRARARLGLVPAAHAELIAATACADRFPPTELARRARGAANPVVVVAEALILAVAEQDPTAARALHFGYTSQDVLDTATMLVARRALDVIRTDLGHAAQILADVAEEHRATTLSGLSAGAPGREAMPVTVGLKAAGWLPGLLTAAEQLDRTAARLPVRLGGAAEVLAACLEQARPYPGPGLTGHDLVARAQRLMTARAHEAGLAGDLAWAAGRVPVAELGATLALVAAALGEIAVGVQALTRRETAEASEPGAIARGVSAAMPYERNPALAAMVRAAALQVPAHALLLFQSMAAEEERLGGAWQAEWPPLRECLRLTGGAAEAMAHLLEGVRPYATVLRRRAETERAGPPGPLPREGASAVLTDHLVAHYRDRSAPTGQRSSSNTGSPRPGKRSGREAARAPLPGLSGLVAEVREGGAGSRGLPEDVEADVVGGRGHRNGV